MKKIILIIILVASNIVAQAQQYIITNYGVGTDSTKLSTTAIQQVIDKAHENGGGTIVIPKGVFLAGALFFKPKTKLSLLEGAVLKGSCCGAIGFCIYCEGSFQTSLLSKPI